VGPLPERRAVEYDVAFLGSLTSPERFVMRAGLDGLEAEGVRVRTLQKGESLPWASYIDILARSRIAISVRGSGFDTYRYWEIPAAGALLLAETPGIVIPGNFVDGREAVFAPVGELALRARELLERDTDAIAAAGRARLKAAHTSVHRAQVVLDALAAL
jgi:hypothetical protein